MKISAYIMNTNVIFFERTNVRKLKSQFVISKVT